ncbi:hypothetical protein TGAM01_v205320 [Trichoderma gamsii]|uniref:Uncharacterized protein n=1 Tax=Trichoderma gamsii TaxID=398673 RepID=A0A2P4ZNL5_9HYPO|nr:hypothetical protein TGAM01_v205320 [Trichoderma gamsii]PON25883.1 hypothetical protein TGAM01_v205320 [Trichoderma gamsii]
MQCATWLCSQYKLCVRTRSKPSYKYSFFRCSCATRRDLNSYHYTYKKRKGVGYQYYKAYGQQGETVYHKTKTNPPHASTPEESRLGKVIPIILPSKIAPKLLLHIHDIPQMPYPERLLSRLCQTQGQLNCSLNVAATEVVLHEFPIVFITECLGLPEILTRNSANGSLEDDAFTFSVWLFKLLDKVNPRLICLFEYLDLLLVSMWHVTAFSGRLSRVLLNLPGWYCMLRR